MVARAKNFQRLCLPCQPNSFGIVKQDFQAKRPGGVNFHRLKHIRNIIGRSYYGFVAVTCAAAVSFFIDDFEASPIVTIHY